MDEDGFVALASVANLAHRARVSIEEATQAASCLEAPDPNSSDPEHEGRRIERVSGGWIVLNATKYRSLVTRTVQREQTRIRVARHREKTGKCNAAVTKRNAKVTVSNDDVTPSETVTHTDTESAAKPKEPSVAHASDRGVRFAEWFRTLLPENANPSPNWKTKWSECYDSMVRLDKRTAEEITLICKWARSDDFWSSNFQSPLKLRERKDGVQYFDIFAAKAKSVPPKPPEPPKVNGQPTVYHANLGL